MVRKNNEVNKHEGVYVHVRKSVLKQLCAGFFLGVLYLYLVISYCWSLKLELIDSKTLEWWIPGGIVSTVIFIGFLTLGYLILVYQAGVEE